MNELLKKGDQAAFVDVYYQFHKKVFSFFLKRLKDHVIATELTQETFIKLWNSRHTLSLHFTIDTQLFTIAGSILVDHFRRLAHEKKKINTLAIKAMADIHLSESLPFQAYESDDLLNAMVRGLPPARKKLILLKIRSGFSNKEIAARLSISEKTVEDHVTKALRRIRSALSTLFLSSAAFLLLI